MLFIFAMLQQEEVPTGLVFGFFCAAGAIAMAYQTFNSYRKGYIYRGETEKVHRNQNSAKFKVWFVIQMFFVFFLAALSIYAFLN